MSLTIGDQLEALRDRPEHHRGPSAGAVPLSRACGRVHPCLGLRTGPELRAQRLGVELVGV
jgi:hypothetical protein